MRENRLYGSEGGAAETNRPLLPLLNRRPSGAERLGSRFVAFQGLAPLAVDCRPSGGSPIPGTQYWDSGDTNRLWYAGECESQAKWQNV